MKIILILIIAVIGCAKKPKPIILPPAPEPPPAIELEPEPEPSLPPPVAEPEPKHEPVIETLQPLPIIYFDLDKADLRADQYTALGVMAQGVNGTCVVTGHACPIGTDHYNLNLGFLRAQSVVDYLYEATGIAVYTTDSKGESLPVSLDKNEYWRNRRVEVNCK